MSNTGTFDSSASESRIELSIERSTVATPEQHALWLAAVDSLRRHRGGETLLSAEWSGIDPDTVLDQLTSAQSVWTASLHGRVVGLLVTRDHIIEVVFVEPGVRRRGVARSLLTRVLEADDAPVDAHVLPGDRATKSLFESFSWKARLLTMRGAAPGDARPS